MIERSGHDDDDTIDDSESNQHQQQTRCSGGVGGLRGANTTRDEDMQVWCKPGWLTM